MATTSTTIERAAQAQRRAAAARDAAAVAFAHAQQLHQDAATQLNVAFLELSAAAEELARADLLGAGPLTARLARVGAGAAEGR
jgi:hypothetical protein